MLVFLIWFDFTHKMYRRCILKHKSSLEDIPDEKFFVTLMGMKKGRKEGSEFGPGLAPSFVDAGYLRVCHAELVFEGLFSSRVFYGSTITRIEKKSSDKIRIDSDDPDATPFANTCMITLKDQFYSFKSRSTRDNIVRSISSQSAQEVELAPESL